MQASAEIAGGFSSHEKVQAKSHDRSIGDDRLLGKIHGGRSRPLNRAPILGRLL